VVDDPEALFQEYMDKGDFQEQTQLRNSSYDGHAGRYRGVHGIGDSSRGLELG
jgi:hypothetical protein